MKRICSIALLLLAACGPKPSAALVVPTPTPAPETLIARLLRENFTFAQWHASLGHEPTPAELTALLEALATAQREQPDRKLALTDDAELRRRALRAPEVRAKAMEVFGMTAPDGVPLPTVDQLMHTQPGDNCPICRMRAQAEKAANSAP